MRIPLVLRSLGVLLLAPMVTLPGAEALRPLEATATSRMDAPIRWAALAPATAAAAEPEVAAVDPFSAHPLSVSVDCSDDGCVVQNGLSVSIVLLAVPPSEVQPARAARSVRAPRSTALLETPTPTPGE